jgi:hypothetical protein
MRAEHLQEVTDAGGTTHGDHMNAATAENLATPGCQRLQRRLVAAAFDENDLLHVADTGQIDAYPGNVHHLSTAGHRRSRKPHQWSLPGQACRVE